MHRQWCFKGNRNMIMCSIHYLETLSLCCSGFNTEDHLSGFSMYVHPQTDLHPRIVLEVDIKASYLLLNTWIKCKMTGWMCMCACGECVVKLKERTTKLLNASALFLLQTAGRSVIFFFRYIVYDPCSRFILKIVCSTIQVSQQIFLQCSFRRNRLDIF